MRKLGEKCDPYFEKSYILERPINQTSWEAWQVVDVTENTSTLSLYVLMFQLIEEKWILPPIKPYHVIQNKP